MQNRSTQETLARKLIALCYLSNHCPTFEYHHDAVNHSAGYDYITSRQTLDKRTANRTAALLRLIIGFEPMITTTSRTADCYQLKISLNNITEKDIKKMAARKTKQLNQLANFLNQLNYPGNWCGLWVCVDDALYFQDMKTGFYNKPATYNHFEKQIKQALIDYYKLPCHGIDLNTALTQREKNILKKPTALYLDYYCTDEYELPITPFYLLLMKSMKRLLPKHLRAPARSVEPRKLINSGNFGIIYNGLHKNKMVAIKTTNWLTNNEQGLINEQRILTMLTSGQNKEPLHAGRYNIIRFDGYTINIGNRLQLIMEYLPTGSLESLIQRNAKLCENPNSRYIFADIAHGLSYMHHYEIIHCDLKPANILLSQDTKNPTILHAKLIDFGLSKHKNDNIPVCGSLLYFAPESLENQLQNEQSDVFSMSNIFWEMVAGETIYSQHPALDTPNKLYNHLVTKQQRAIIPSTCPKKISFWIEKGWHQQPEQRPAASECASALDTLTDQDMADTVAVCTPTV